jgi:hypothetical protein
MPSCTANTETASKISWETEHTQYCSDLAREDFLSVSHLEGAVIGTSFTCNEDDIYHEMVDSTGAYLLCIQNE